MALTLGQSVLEVLEEDRFFMSGRLPKRDQMNSRRRLGVNDRNDHSSEKTQRHKALFVVSEAIILESEGRPFEYSGRIDEVQTMVFQV
jgi:hypothetical protein